MTSTRTLLFSDKNQQKQHVIVHLYEVEGDRVAGGSSRSGHFTHTFNPVALSSYQPDPYALSGPRRTLPFKGIVASIALSSTA